MTYVLHFSPIFFLDNLYQSSCKHVFSIKMENSVVPDQIASSKPADLDLHCFQRINPGSFDFLFDSLSPINNFSVM